MESNIYVENVLFCDNEMFSVGDIINYHDYDNRGAVRCTGKIISISFDEVLIDCSSEYNSHLVKVKFPCNNYWDKFTRVVKGRDR